MHKPAITVIMGGTSAEREISLQTGNGVAAALESLGYPTSTVDLDRAFVDVLRARRPAAVFNALHGGAGEDGTVQALLDWLGIAYQGSGVRASAIAMDKWASKAIMRASGVPTPDAWVIRRAQDAWQMPPSDFPCVVKPVGEGSAIGVTLVRSPEQWRTAVESASRFGDLLIEEYIEGREFTAAVLENEALPIVEIAPQDAFYSYRAKYTPGGSRHTVPARLAPEITALMQGYALTLHGALGCRDYSRLDLIMRRDTAELYALECNTLPGLTQLSLFPDAAAAAGIGYEALIDRLVSLALGRAAN